MNTAGATPGRTPDGSSKTGLKEVPSWVKGACNSLLMFDRASFIITGSGNQARWRRHFDKNINYLRNIASVLLILISYARKSTAIQRKRHSRNYEEVNQGSIEKRKPTLHKRP
jgi:hypothetical protein